MIDKNYNPQASIFKCCKSPTVIKDVSIKEILQEIKVGGKNRDILLEARKKGKGSIYFEDVKTKYLNTFTPNATFFQKRSLNDIKSLSGLIYLDIDGSTNIDIDNPYIFASWLSLSATGRGVLVKIEGVNEDNFSLAYDLIAKEIGLDADPNCKDLSRQVVISYDPDIFINASSITYDCEGMVSQERLNTHPKLSYKKKERRKCELKGGNYFNDIRYDNTEDYDLDGKDYEIFDKKVMFSKLFIPEIIKSNRYSTISTTAHQYMALNPDLNLGDGQKFIDVLNTRCLSPLPLFEIHKIKIDLESKFNYGDLTPIPNWERYTIFSEAINTKERQVIGAKVAGRNKRRKTVGKIQECLDNWDLTLGRVTNKKIAEITGLATKTVDKYSKEFFKTQKEIINNNI